MNTPAIRLDLLRPRLKLVPGVRERHAPEVVSNGGAKDAGNVVAKNTRKLLVDKGVTTEHRKRHAAVSEAAFNGLVGGGSEFRKSKAVPDTRQTPRRARALGAFVESLMTLDEMNDEAFFTFLDRNFLMNKHEAISEEMRDAASDVRWIVMTLWRSFQSPGSNRLAGLRRAADGMDRYFKEHGVYPKRTGEKRRKILQLLERVQNDVKGKIETQTIHDRLCGIAHELMGAEEPFLCLLDQQMTELRSGRATVELAAAKLSVFSGILGEVADDSLDSKLVRAARKKFASARNESRDPAGD